MPHLVVDGMNVIGSRPDGWWRDRARATRRLLGRLQTLHRTTGDPVTLVLDGRPLPDVPEGAHDGVQVLYARRGGADAADDRIVEFVAGLENPSAVAVVTSDRGLRARVGELGTPAMGAGALLARLDEADPT
ncbi:MAG TPA: NYN domain-containing protein [Acidimicrobiia bacterium]|nr:NYN domain-containing protein [Acidimicrobiia bacterium]